MGKRNKKSLTAVTLVLLLAAIGGCEAYRSNTLIDAEHIRAGIKNLPAEFEGFRIAHISDLHGYKFGDNNAKLGDLMRAEKPDIIAITGDFIENAEDFEMIFATAKLLADIAPTYYVPGNHEYASRISPAIFSELSLAGVRVLRNQSEILRRGGSEIVILGIDDPNGPADMISMAAAVDLVRDKTGAPIIMLNHRYDRADEIAELDVAAALTGHAHGGVIRLPFTDGIIGPGRVILPKRTSGKYDVAGLTLVVSRGLGNAGISFRMFNRPHIPIVDLTGIK